jgi:TrmH family RNA methyltransferase
VVALARLPLTSFESFLAAGPHGLVFVLDAVNDPGNAGTIVRTAEAVGADAVVFAGNSTDPYGPKAVRASAGSAFRLRVVVAGPTAEAVAALAEAGMRCVGTVASGGVDHRKIALRGDVTIVLGSEGHGLGPEVEERLDDRVTIPMRGRVESLNVAAAAAVLGYERMRQSDAAGDEP